MAPAVAGDYGSPVRLRRTGFVFMVWAMSRHSTYPGGMPALLAQMEGRRNPFTYAEGEGLPPVDADLAPLAGQIVGDPTQDADEAPPFRSSYHRKRFALRDEFEGESELCFLNGLLISHLRKRSWPDAAPVLFQRLWAEHGRHLLERLNPRWLVSSVTTFGDHGVTPIQRSVGLALSVLFGAMKLYESERLYSGLKPSQPFGFGQKAAGPLPLEMDAYALRSGGLDVNMIGRLWQEADGDDVIAPLAHELLEQLIADDRTVMARLMAMRVEKERGTPPERPNDVAVPVRRGRRGPPRWGVVATVRAPLAKIARFAAHHLDLGAEEVHLYLDAPDDAAVAFLTADPRVHVTECGPEYWERIGKRRPEGHQQRQAINATRCLRAVQDRLDWLAHLDVDEFLMPSRAVSEALAEVESEAAYARVSPLEALGREDRSPVAFKAPVRNEAALQDIYPTFGLHLRAGFVSHVLGKSFVRTGLTGVRFGLHHLRRDGAPVTNADELADLRVAHFHAASWPEFREKLDFRRSLGGYRAPRSGLQMPLSEMFGFLLEDGGEAGLRRFYDEVCADTPRLRQALSDRGALVEADLELDTKVRRVFGQLP